MSNEGDGEDRHKSIHGAETDLMQEMRYGWKYGTVLSTMHQSSSEMAASLLTV